MNKESSKLLIEGFTKLTASHALNIFKATGCDNFFFCNVIDPEDNEEYTLSFARRKQQHLFDEGTEAADYYSSGFEAGQQAKEEWIKVEDKVPEMIEGKDYSENVIAICDGKRMVMNYARIYDDGNSFYAWCNCYGDIDGDAEFDDEYNPNMWVPIPIPPKE